MTHHIGPPLDHAQPAANRPGRDTESRPDHPVPGPGPPWPPPPPRSDPPHKPCAATTSPAATHASPHTSGTKTGEAAPAQPHPPPIENGRNPTPVNTPSGHDGHDTSPAANRDSTRTGPTSTVTISAFRTRHGAPGGLRQEISGGAVHPSVPRHTDGAEHQHQTHTAADHHIGILNDDYRPDTRHPRRRSTVGNSHITTRWPTHRTGRHARAAATVPHRIPTTRWDSPQGSDSAFVRTINKPLPLAVIRHCC